MLGRHVYRVKPVAEAWSVAKEGETKPRGTRPSRGAAVAFACDLALADQPSRVVVEERNGTLADERSFGSDASESGPGE